MRRLRAIGLFVGLGLYLPAAVASPTLDELVGEALANTPRLSAAHAKAAAANQRIVPAEALPDPAVELAGLAMGVNPPGPRSMLTVEVKQEIPYPGKRAARRDLLAAEAEVRTLETDEVRSEVVFEVRKAYAQARVVDSELAAMTTVGEWIDKLGSAIVARYGVGEGSRVSNLMLLAERAKVRQRLLRVRAERLSMVAELARLTGRAMQDFDAPFSPLPEIQRVEISAEALAESPELRRRHAQVAAASRMVGLAEREERPDFMVSGGGGVDGMGGPVVMAKVGMSLPLWNARKQRPLSQASRHDMATMEAEYEDARRKLMADVQGQQGQFDQAELRVKALREELIPANDAALTAALQAFATRQADLAMVLLEVTGMADGKVELARAEADRFLAWASLIRIASPTRVALGGR